MNFKKLPKIELHCHLDGSIRVNTAIDLIKKEKLNMESLEYDFIKKKLMVEDECNSLDEYLEKFELPLKLMQSKENLERIAYELIEDSYKENIKYIEIRFAPLLHLEKGLKISSVIESILKGMKKGEKEFGVKSGLILCILRHMPKDRAKEVIEIGKNYIGSGVVALDLAGSELEGFAREYKDIFSNVKEYGYKVTIHAGETGFSNNVIDSIKMLGAKRIGHGIAILNDKKAHDLVKNENIVLEMCPKSNVQTKAIQSYEHHPIKKFLKEEIKATLCTDNNTVSNVSLTEEWISTNRIQGLDIDDYKRIYINGVEGAFCSEQVKEDLLKEIKNFK